eukprot:tig00020908_g15309.t1
MAGVPRVAEVEGELRSSRLSTKSFLRGVIGPSTGTSPSPPTQPMLPRSPTATAATAGASQPKIPVRALLSDLQLRWATAPLPPARGTAIPFYAAAVLVDVSGSSTAAERFVLSAAAASPATATQRAAAALGAALNRTFARVIQRARVYGGDAVQFLGDAVLVLVYAPAEEALEGAARAAVKIATAVVGLDALEAGPGEDGADEEDDEYSVASDAMEFEERRGMGGLLTSLDPGERDPSRPPSPSPRTPASAPSGTPRPRTPASPAPGTPKRGPLPRNPSHGSSRGRAGSVVDEPSPTASAGEEELRLHVAVSCGRFFALRLGEDDARGDGRVSILGTPLARLAAGIRLADAQQVCLAPEVARTTSCGFVPLRQRTREGYAVFGASGMPGGEDLPRRQSLSAPVSARRPSGSAPNTPRLSAVDDPPARSPRSPQTAAGGAGAVSGNSGRFREALRALGQSFKRGAGAVAPAPREAAEGETGSEVPGPLRDSMLMCLPRDLRAALEHRARLPMELRPVTCACVRVDGFSSAGLESPEFPKEKLQWLLRCARVLQSALEGGGGVIRGLFVDQDDLCCVATWGAIGAEAGPEDAFRAAGAALRIRDGFSRDGLGPASVGIATAPTFVGIVGDESRAEFSCIGRACSQAARLMRAAAGGAVLVDGETRRALEGRLVTEEADLQLPPGDSGGAYSRAPQCFRVVSRPEREARAKVPRSNSRRISMRLGSLTAASDPTGASAIAAAAAAAVAAAAAGGAVEEEEAAAAAAAAMSVEQAREALQVAAASPECGVFGRREALGQVVELLAAARAGAGSFTLFVEGGPGHGKSAIFSEAERLAAVVDVPVLSVQADPKEMYPYEAVRGLLIAMVRPEREGAEGAPSRPAGGTNPRSSVTSDPRSSVGPGSGSVTGAGTGAGGAGAGLGAPAAAPTSRLPPLSASSLVDPTEDPSLQLASQVVGKGFAGLAEARALAPPALSPAFSPSSSGAGTSTGLPPSFFLGANASPPPRATSGSPQPGAAVTTVELSDGRSSPRKGHVAWGEVSEPASPRGPVAGAAHGTAVRDAVATLDGRMEGDARAFVRALDPQLATPYNVHVLARLLTDATFYPSGRARGAGGGFGDRSATGSASNSAPHPAAGLLRSRSPSLVSFMGDPEDPGSPAGAMVDYPMEPGSQAHRLFLFLAALLETALRRLGALLLVDDLHALDAPSMKLLSFVAMSSSAYVFVTSRPVPGHTVCPEYSALRRSDRTRLVTLGPLESVEEVRGYVARVLKVRVENFSEWLAHRLMEKSGGSPYALREMALHLLRCGLIEVDNGRVLAGLSMLDSQANLSRASMHSNGSGSASRLPPPYPPSGPPVLDEEHQRGFPVPETLRSVAVLSHLDRVPALPALVIKLCSALGPRFEAGLAQYAIEGAVEWRATAASLTVLERHGLLSRVTVAGGLHEYLFVQPSHAEVLRSVLSKDDLAYLAWRSAEYLARTALRRNKAVAHSIACHYVAAGAHELASPYLDVAAAVAVEEGRYRDALAIANQSLAVSYGKSLPTLAPFSARRSSTNPGWAVAAARRWQLHAAACYSLGRAAQALQSAEQCLKTMGLPTAEQPPSTLAVLAALLRAALARAARPAAASLRQRRRLNEWGDTESLENALAEHAAPPEEQRAAVLSRVLSVYVPLLLHTGDAASAAFYATKKLKAAGRCKDPLERAEALALAGSALAHVGGRARAGERLLEMSRAASATLPGGRVSGVCLVAQIAADVLAARFAAIDAAARTGASRLLAVHGASHLLRGNEAEAARLFDALIRQAREGDNRQQLLWGLVGWASSRMLGPGPSSPPATGGLSEENVAGALLEARAAFAEERFVLEALLVRAAAARLRLLEGRPEEAEAEAMAGVEALRQHRRRRLPAAAGVPPLALALAARRTASRRNLVYGGPLLATFAQRNSAAAADYGETEEGWTRCLRAALRDVLAALAAGAARHAAAAAASALHEGRWLALLGSQRRARARFEKAFALARAAGMRPFAERASALGQLGYEAPDGEQGTTLGFGARLLSETTVDSIAETEKWLQEARRASPIAVPVVMGPGPAALPEEGP